MPDDMLANRPAHSSPSNRSLRMPALTEALTQLHGYGRQQGYKAARSDLALTSIYRVLPRFPGIEYARAACCRIEAGGLAASAGVSCGDGACGGRHGA